MNVSCFLEKKSIPRHCIKNSGWHHYWAIGCIQSCKEYQGTNKKYPKFTLTTHKYKPQNLYIQHFLWILKGCPIPFGRSVVHPFGKIGPTAATAFGGWGGPDRSTLFLSRKRVKKKPIGPNHCSFLLRSLQCTQMEAKFYSCVHYPKNLTYQTIRQPKIYLNKVNTNFIHHKNNIVIPITKPLQPFLSLKAFSQWRPKHDKW